MNTLKDYTRLSNTKESSKHYTRPRDIGQGPQVLGNKKNYYEQRFSSIAFNDSVTTIINGVGNIITDSELQYHQY